MGANLLSKSAVYLRHKLEGFSGDSPKVNQDWQITARRK